MQKYFFFLATLLLLTACNNEAQRNTKNDSTTSTASPNTPQTSCYEYIHSKDTARMVLNQRGNEVTGELTYQWYEKDSNRGTFTGKLENDLLVAWYTYQAEGMTSVREEIFKMENGQLKKGAGEMEYRNDTAVFTNRSQLNFTNGIIFTKADCK